MRILGSQLGGIPSSSVGWASSDGLLGPDLEGLALLRAAFRRHWGAPQARKAYAQAPWGASPKPKRLGPKRIKA
jgi:hypothetical protein